MALSYFDKVELMYIALEEYSIYIGGEMDKTNLLEYSTKFIDNPKLLKGCDSRFLPFLNKYIPNFFNKKQLPSWL